MRRLLPLCLTALAVLTPQSRSSVDVSPPVELVRVPDGGVQPEIVVDDAGVVHMVYLAGEAAAANVFYVHSADAGRTFSRPVRVNSQEGSAIAIGTIRGAQIAAGRDGRVHVAWNGSSSALPKAPVNPETKRPGTPMLYARSTPGGMAFEPQRNVITRTTNLDGGGSIAADDRGGVYVAWHAHPASGKGGEQARRVWLARSPDDGATFGEEQPVSDPATGVCGCCALRLFAAPTGDLHVLYRSATDLVHRDVYSLVSHDRGRTFTGGRVHGWEVGACPMTSMALAAGKRLWQAWETEGQVYFSRVDAAGPPNAVPVTGSGESSRRKHPRLGIVPTGTLMLAWTEGAAWGRGGALAWQAFGPDGRATSVRGSQPGVPAWSYAAVVPRGDGSFTIVY